MIQGLVTPDRQEMLCARMLKRVTPARQLQKPHHRSAPAHLSHNYHLMLVRAFCWPLGLQAFQAPLHSWCPAGQLPAWRKL